MWAGPEERITYRQALCVGASGVSTPHSSIQSQNGVLAAGTREGIKGIAGRYQCCEGLFSNAVRTVWFIKCSHQLVFDQHIGGSRRQVTAPPAGLSGLLIILISNLSSYGLHMELLHGCYLWNVLGCQLKRVQI